MRPIEDLLHTLRPPGQPGNRRLFADHLLIAHLVACFSPALKSLRRVEDVFDHPAARRKYGLPPLPHSTVSVFANAITLGFDEAVGDFGQAAGEGFGGLPAWPWPGRLDRELSRFAAADVLQHPGVV